VMDKNWAAAEEVQVLVVEQKQQELELEIHHKSRSLVAVADWAEPQSFVVAAEEEELAAAADSAVEPLLTERDSGESSRHLSLIASS